MTSSDRSWPVGVEFREEAFAKINLRLKVVGRRDDGYHLLSMLNASTTLRDSISLTLTEGEADGVAVSGSNEILRGVNLDGPDNIAAKAARRFLDAHSIPLRFRLEIEKRIPLGGGLGGGSADAAGVLRILTRVLGSRRELEMLDLGDPSSAAHRIAASLGADVPYLLYGGYARVTGVGETIHPFAGQAISGSECILLLPSFGIETPRVFSELRRRRPVIDATVDREAEILAASAAPSRELILRLVENDLEEIVFSLEPRIEKALRTLRATGSVVAGMSGSGSTLFVLPVRRPAFDADLRSAITEHAAVLGMSSTLVTLR